MEQWLPSQSVLYKIFKGKDEKTKWGEIQGTVTDQLDLVAYIASQVGMPNLQYLHFIEDQSHLPPPVGGVHTLLTGHAYYITGTVNLLAGNRIVMQEGSTLIGSSSETSYLNATLATGQVMITCIKRTPIRDLTIGLSPLSVGDQPEYLFVDGQGDPQSAIDWDRFNISGVYTLGEFNNVENVIVRDCAFLGAGDGFRFVGNFGSIVFEGSIFRDTFAGGILLDFSGVTAITRRIRIENTPIIVPIGSVGLNLPPAVPVPTEGYILEKVNFSGGGTCIQGVNGDDNKSLFINVRGQGVINSAATSHYYMQNNAVATTIGNVADYFKALGTTTQGGYTQRFSYPTSNRAQYIGALSQRFLATITCSLKSTNNQKLYIAVYYYNAANPLLSGIITDSISSNVTDGNGRIEMIAAQTFLQLNQNDYFEIHVRNGTSTAAVTVENMNVIATPATS